MEAWLNVTLWKFSFSRPYDNQTYEDEIDEDEVLDEEGRARLKLKVCFNSNIITCTCARLYCFALD